LSNFSKEFYHWLAVSDNEAQRVAAKFRGGTLLRLTQIYTKHLINRIIFR